MDPFTRLADAVVWFDAEGVRSEELIDAATELVADGLDEPAVLALACLPHARVINTFELDAAVAQARDVLGLASLDDAALHVRAAQALARRWLSGRVEDTRLTGWANEHCDRDEEGPLSPLLRMDHQLHSRDVTGKTVAELRAMLRAEVERLLARHDPWVRAEPPTSAGESAVLAP